MCGLVCACYLKTKLNGLNALSSTQQTVDITEIAPRLVLDRQSVMQKNSPGKLLTRTTGPHTGTIHDAAGRRLQESPPVFSLPGRRISVAA